jgi:hypothetical protein
VSTSVGWILKTTETHRWYPWNQLTASGGTMTFTDIFHTDPSSPVLTCQKPSGTNTHWREKWYFVANASIQSYSFIPRWLYFEILLNTISLLEHFVQIH